MKKLSLLGLAVLLSACQSMQSAPKASLDGEVFYLQRSALPPTAILSVSLQDVSLADAPAVVIDEQKSQVKGQVPLPFHLSYDPARSNRVIATPSARALKLTASCCSSPLNIMPCNSMAKTRSS
ncbi:hypothetical protein D3C76_455880 [compost metagenome]|jgi:uncharacterized lipoprotein YbaY|uniref:Lipoprotein n=1 Tax=Pseudomonas fluorescens TaxID=294 RepID=A0A5E6SAC7_PSEFL|nr:hypothetical protein PS647_02139 [Pseudomonas fluorescens]VVM92124.1 hypothetical protein PS673_02843 [Pseudomonas fluorescens]VVP36064.1 hypothetical protein PS893_04604 [Pseudomonas fluorescens]